MTFPSLVFGSIIAFILGALFHLIVGGGLIRIIISLLSSVIGFWVGHYIGYQINLDLFTLGFLHIGTGIVGAIIFLVLGYWLTLIQVEPE